MIMAINLTRSAKVLGRTTISTVVGVQRQMTGFETNHSLQYSPYKEVGVAKLNTVQSLDLHPVNDGGILLRKHLKSLSAITRRRILSPI